MEKLLEVKNLSVSFKTYIGEVKAVRDISYDISKGETLAVVGESGCGKTVSAKAILRLLNKSMTEIGDDSEILFTGKDILKMDNKKLSSFRGNEISMIFQNPMSSLNPTMKCGKQVMESLMLHQNLNIQEAKKEAIKLFELVKIPDPEKRIESYPHQLSGGMRQRVMIAMALACNPSVLIADEPTTALDVTIQAQIMDLMKEIKETLGTSIIMVTHDLGVVANFADRVQVMYAGRIVERGTVKEVFMNPSHPYTVALLKSIPKLNAKDRPLYSLEGTPPDLLLDLNHCAFADRCEYAMKLCKKKMPEPVEHSKTHITSCWLNHDGAKTVRSRFLGDKDE